VRLAIDDFGTGYSSLSYLTRLPVDMVKIDKSFVDDADISNQNPVPRAILALAEAMHLVTVAEGIEHPRQAVCMRTLGCRLGQGYLFARPAPAEETTRLLDAPYVAEPLDPQTRLARF
jgi:EAL domain-containing protein (putative c-di-GMP-specific phosphodiesterase class I)